MPSLSHSLLDDWSVSHCRSVITCVSVYNNVKCRRRRLSACFFSLFKVCRSTTCGWLSCHTWTCLLPVRRWLSVAVDHPWLSDQLYIAQ